jgi:hypothetical protein
MITWRDAVLLKMFTANDRCKSLGRKRFLDYLQGKSHLLETNEVL